MKTILLTVVVWALTAAAGYGQGKINAAKVGSAEAASRIFEYQQSLREPSPEREAASREYRKALEFGRSLFGADKRWTEGELPGTLATKNPPDFKVGDWGCTSAWFRVLNKLSDTECLVLPRYKIDQFDESTVKTLGPPSRRLFGVLDDSEVMLIRGLDMSKASDGVQFVLQYPVVIQGTYSYTAVSGSQKTVLVLERNDSKLNEIAEAADKRWEDSRKAAEDALFRKRTDSTGKFSVAARFIEFKNARVRLERKEDRKEIDIPMSRLSKYDQEWIRDELGRGREEKRQAAAEKAAAKKLQAKKARGR